MAKFFYDCPVKALYMTKHFGVVCEFDLPNLDQEEAEKKMLRLAKFLEAKKIDVAPESEEIFEPKQSMAIPKLNHPQVTERWTTEDKGVDEEGNICMFVGRGWILENQLADERGADVVGKVQIIMRDGKQFFQPLLANLKQ